MGLPPALYAAFDRVPAPKGASTHIARFSRVLFEHAGGGLLYVVGGPPLPPWQREGTTEVVRFSEPVPNLLERTVAFGRRLRALLDERGGALRIAHFRDPWSGVPILDRPHGYRTIYEVNGLPSVELPFAYPAVAPSTLEKIRGLERFCLERADHVVVPSAVLRGRLLAMGVEPGRVTVIPNGADVDGATSPRPADAPAAYLLYFGALQAWQGVDTLLRAFARLADLPALHLVICASAAGRRGRGYAEMAERLGIETRVHWRWGLSQEELAPWRAHALASVAPLADCTRNTEQGCAPLKILESLAAGVPVVASDLPAVREIMRDREHGRLVHPDRPGELARALRVLLDDEAERRATGERARAHAAAHLTWTRSEAMLAGLLHTLDPQREMP